ncbi:MAG: family 20 glycosylhydrolase, partial [Odoribacter sp.]|nr:family 20 glycosylhydrolase [Odoribacter sp.]
FYFIKLSSDSVVMLGKSLVGWDELLDSDIPADGTLILWWRHDRVNQLKKSLAKGYETVMCPRRPLYFDFIQHKDHKWGRVWSGFCPIEDVYAFPDKGMATWGIPAEQLTYIRGIQANAWTERMHNTERLDFMTFPRICALAEAAWTSAVVKNYESFTKRMEKAYGDFDRAGIYYFDARNPGAHPEPAGPQQQKRNMPMDFRD